MKEEEIETLTRRVQKLRIELSEAEAELARKKEQMANKRTMRTNANTKLSTNGVMAHKEKINIHTKAEGKADVVMVPGDHVIKAQLAWKKEQMANKGKMRTNANTKLSTNGVTMANKEKININTEAEGKADVVMVPGDRVMITWDRYWQWNRSTWRMPKTPYEGSKGTVIRTSECFVWVELNDTHIILQKRKHNVKLVASEKD